MQREAGFEIGETTWLPYDAADTYFRALQVGLLNTLRVSLFAIVLATGLGGLIGLARFSSNWLLTTIATAYVEIIRNVPLVVQLFFLYAWMTELLPAPAQALEPLQGVFLSNRGVAFPIIIGLAPLELEYPQFRGFYRRRYAVARIRHPALRALVIYRGLYRRNRARRLPIDSSRAS